MGYTDGMIITICSSANFYKHVVELQEELEQAGHTVLIPHNANEMKKTGNFDTSHRTWLQDPNDYHKKTNYMKLHLKEIEKGDVILVVNDEKNGKSNYIGGNVLIEMSIAFYLKKKIYILGDIPDESPYLEEIIGMEPIVLNGQLSLIK
jgi:hypothetical protein